MAKQALIGKVSNSKIYCGEHTYGIKNLTIKQWGEGAALKIGSFCSIADNVRVFLGGNHRTDWITTFPFGHISLSEFPVSGIVGHPATKGDVVIENDVWIGHGVTIFSGVRVANGAVLAANANVSCDVGAYEIFAGNPARLVKTRFSQPIVERLLVLRWWELDASDIGKLIPKLCATPTVELLDQLLREFRPNTPVSAVGE